jgi:two-component system, OmpR family, copper resistance phosphate regulon response regulator CusR
LSAHHVGGLHGIAPGLPMGIRILIVEDEAELADFVIRGLREEGFVVEHVVDGELARDAMRLATWDLIVLDWWLPGEDGLSVLRRFRQAGGTTPVLFLTARDAVADRVRGLDGGADDYLCKPFAFDELLARVRALVRRRDRSPDMVLAQGDVSIDLAAHRARRAGRPLDLTAKELALLTFFLRHPGQVLSRTRIYDHVWDETFDGLSNTLEVHVMELRRKLEAHGPRVIQTVRGRGYLYEAATPAGAP